MWAQFNGFEIEMTRKQAESVSHSGQCDNDVIALLEKPVIKNQLKKIGPDKIRQELNEYGAWDDEQLKNHEDNLHRIIWIAGCNITDV